jgi:uncharacterized membrane protein (UPF0182 family)
MLIHKPCQLACGVIHVTELLHKNDPVRILFWSFEQNFYSGLQLFLGSVGFFFFDLPCVSLKIEKCCTNSWKELNFFLSVTSKLHACLPLWIEKIFIFQAAFFSRQRHWNQSPLIGLFTSQLGEQAWLFKVL